MDILPIAKKYLKTFTTKQNELILKYVHSEQFRSLAGNVLRIKNRFNVFYTLLVADCKTFKACKI